ncbi:hypothetical protein [Streptomyces sp. BBFR109]|uniref:hypothetical protein n=1 Tax=Streptomyces sp. BBFR109 TaxID=3448172 RepID=UPI003F775C16
MAGGILQMAQRIAAAVAVSAVPGSYPRGTSAPAGAPRTAFAHATVLGAGLPAAAAVLSLLRPRLSAPPAPRPPPRARTSRHRS